MGGGEVLFVLGFFFLGGGVSGGRVFTFGGFLGGGIELENWEHINFYVFFFFVVVVFFQIVKKVNVLH